jgi:3-oxoacyl-[acyl-carrier protein] reductase
VSYTREQVKVLNLDFAQIQVGDDAEIRHTLSQADVDAFAALTGDYNPLHVDESFSRKTMFRRPVVHGMVSASFISTLIGTLMPGSGALWTSQTIEFLLPAFVGDTITVKGVVEQKSVATRVLILKVKVLNQHGHELIVGTSHVKVLEIKEESRAMTTERSQVVLITGGSKGIGAAVARQLASQGHQVVINFNSGAAEAKALVEELAGKGGKALAVQGNVAVDTDVARLVAAAEAEFGPVDHVVHCAAPLPIPTSFEELTWARFHTQLEVQLHGAFNCAKAVLPSLVARKTGSLVFIGSIFTDGVPPAQQSAYVATKAALSAFARTLAVEYGPKGVRVNVVSPGMTQTDMISSLPDKVKMLTKMQTPLRRLAEAADIAKAVEFLVGPSALHITGETLRVCGGIAMI